MERNELMTLVLGLIICFLVGGTIALFLRTIYKQRMILIKEGLVDEEIRKEYKLEESIGSKIIAKINVVLSTLITIIFLLCFAVSIYSKVYNNDFPVCGIANVRVVNSGSMSEVHDENDYLIENNLTNQFDKYDIILTYELPDEYDLKLYDIVVYEVNDILVVHRIIGIEEPNEKHPDCRYFLLKGDANEYGDKFPVLYSQMRAIYKGENIPFVGMVVTFMQSPLGFLSIIIIFLYCIIVPIYGKKMENAAKDRLRYLISVGGRRIHTGNQTNEEPFLKDEVDKNKLNIRDLGDK